MGLVFKNGQWSLEKAAGESFSILRGSSGGEFLRKSASSILTGSLLPPSGAVSHSNIFSARWAGGDAAATSSRISANRQIASLDIDDFSSGFTWAAWINTEVSATNSNSTMFFSSDLDGKDAVILRRSGTSDNIVFEYYTGNVIKGKATTDSTPWTDGAWVHYGLTFSDTEVLKIYKNGVEIQFDVNTDVGGSTPSNVTSHTFQTSIPNSNRVDFRMFGGDLKTAGNHGLTGEVFNIGFWNEAITTTEMNSLYNNPGHDLSTNIGGGYSSSANLLFNCKFDQTAADGTNIALIDRGLANRYFISGSTKPT